MKSTIALAKNRVCHNQSKHTDTYYHYIRECIKRKDVPLEYVKTHDQVVEIFTKPLNKVDFTRLRDLLGRTKSSLRGDVEI